MRDPTPEYIRQQKLLLSNLEIEFTRINRRNVNRDLRNSLFTKILEMKAAIESMETKLLRATRTKGRASKMLMLPHLPQMSQTQSAGAD